VTKTNNQTYLLKTVKSFYDKFKSEKFFPNFDTSIYLASYSGKSISNQILSQVIGEKQNIFSNFITVIKDVFYSVNYESFKTYFNYTNKDFRKVILTWASVKDFKNNGSFHDRYLNLNSSKMNDTLWFVIYLDNNLPAKLAKNIFIYKPIFQKKFNFFQLFKIFFLNLSLLLKDKNYFLSSISNYNYFSKKISNTFLECLSSKTEKILMFYEGQPFQNEIIRLSKKYFEITTIGYIHAPPVAFPSSYIKKQFSPDLIFLNGSDQLKLFSKIGWKKKQIKLCPSFRFSKNKKPYAKKFFLPINFNNHYKIIENVEFISKMYNLNNYSVNIHPVSVKSHNSIILKKKIMSTIKKNKPKKNFKYPIFIGATGSIIEALENNCKKAIHITDNDIVEKYSSELWQSLKVQKIKSNIYLYELKKKGNLLKLGKKNTNPNILFKN